MSEINILECYTTAVCIENLCKSYCNSDNGKDMVLNNFCMRVKKGSMSVYGFLGASGCGKTTVLSCIVGLKKWDSGKVLVFSKEPRSKGSGIPGKIVGYMPQELALYSQLSINEIMSFYGKLYGIPHLIVRKQWKELSKLLDLSKVGPKLVGQLSGGQKRRASLAVALIHLPQLLVLDEPTVGLDPVLRETIWNYLYQIASKFGTTIIITTHYIEEARYSDMIGLTRRGRMLVEKSPSELMEQYETNLLEKVVMKICQMDKTGTGIMVNTAENCKDELTQSQKLRFNSPWKLKNDQSAHCSELKDEIRVLSSFDVERGNQKKQILAGKSLLDHSRSLRFLQKTCGFTWILLLTFFRHPIFLMALVLMPAFQGTITLWTLGSKPIGLRLGIINHEVGDWITACESTQNHTFIDNKLIPDCQLTSDFELKKLSCQYLKQLRKDNVVDLMLFHKEDEARAQVELGKCWGYMVIPENFTQNFGDLLLAKQYAMNDSIEGSRIPVYLDYSQSISSLYIIRHIFTSYMNYMTELAKSCSMNEKMVDVPLNFRQPIYGDNDDNYTAFVMPGLLLFTIFGIGCALPALLIIDDRKQGTLSRAKVACISCSNVIASHIIVQGILTLAQLAIWNIILYFIFSISFIGQVWLYVLICLLCGFSGSAWGIFVGLVVSNEVEAIYIGSVFGFILLFRCGIIWPTEALSQFWQVTGSILPTYLPTQSLRSVTIRGVGILHQLVWPGILASVLWTIAFVIFSVILYRKKI